MALLDPTIPPTDWPHSKQEWAHIVKEIGDHSVIIYYKVDERLCSNWRYDSGETHWGGFPYLVEWGGLLTLTLTGIRNGNPWFQPFIPANRIVRIEYRTQKMRKLNPVIWEATNPSP
jgi:hypothetical protein